jgi:hypothetical protein
MKLASFLQPLHTAGVCPTGDGGIPTEDDKDNTDDATFSITSSYCGGSLE